MDGRVRSQGKDTTSEFCLIVALAEGREKMPISRSLASVTLLLHPLGQMPASSMPLFIPQTLHKASSAHLILQDASYHHCTHEPLTLFCFWFSIAPIT